MKKVLCIIFALLILLSSCSFNNLSEEKVKEMIGEILTTEYPNFITKSKFKGTWDLEIAGWDMELRPESENEKTIVVSTRLNCNPTDRSSSWREGLSKTKFLFKKIENQWYLKSAWRVGKGDPNCTLYLDD